MLQNKEYRLTRRLLLSTLASAVTSIAISAQTPPKKPQLVVGIVVEGLQSEYLDLLDQYFCDGGFKRLLRDGAVIDNIEYGPGADAAAATAMIYTGTGPAVNGISASTVYDASRQTTYPVLLDPSKIGNYTNETYSPSAILVSTLSHEVRMDNVGTGYVHSIAPDAIQSIIMTGHAGNSAFWLNDITGRWATTTYYKDVPPVITNRNFSAPLSARLDTLEWTPSLQLEQYPDVPDYKKIYPFHHTFRSNDIERFAKFKQSAPMNREITSIALDYISSMHLGTHGAMDMLNVYYTLAPFPGVKDADTRLELLDSYLKLDIELQRLLKAVDAAADIKNTVIFVAGTPQRNSDKPDDPKWAVPYGEFFPRRAISLLNMYLMALHGTGDWVTGYHNGQFYLNKDLIKEKGLDLRAIRSDVADFLLRMSGVCDAWTVDDILAARVGSRPDLVRRNTNVNHSGDVFISVNPGWEIVEEHPGGMSRRILSRAQATTAPFIIMAPQIIPTRIDTPVDVLSIAPTVARVLRIRSPNAAANPTISTIFAPINKK